MESPNDSRRWQRLNALFEGALRLQGDTRARYISQECGSDRDLRRELESLLEAAEDPTDFIGQTVQAAARDLVGQGQTTSLSPGALLSHYRVLELIGGGGMGQVYAAEDVRLHRKVALKALSLQYLNDRDALRRFEQEARAASALNHPNILTIYEIEEWEGVDFIACELVEGQTLRAKLRAGPLPLRTAIDIALQVASGLAAAHAQGITHRDIKPENIIVRDDGIVKIVDFGVAKLAEKIPVQNRAAAAGQVTLASITNPGTVIGTAKYMSPEQARGLLLDGRSDLFSLGTVLYEMICGRAPFEGQTDSDLIAEILKTEPTPLRQLKRDVPSELSRIVTKATRKERTERYASAGELLSDLQRLSDALPAAGGQPVSGGAAQLLRRPRKRAGAMTAAAVLLAVALLVAGIVRRHHSKPAFHRPQSLAILPFRNLKPDPATDFLGFSLADAAISKFAGIGSLVVRPSSSIDRYRNITIDPEKAGADLHVDTLLTGTYVKDGDELRIATQLISVRPLAILWQRTIDVQYKSLLSVQDALAQQIISGLALQLTPAEAASVRAGQTQMIDQVAYEDYLRGVDLYATNDFRSAIEMLQRAAALAPDYALTWAHLGRAYTTNASLSFGGRDQYAKAQAAYTKALELNSGLVEPRVYMANLFTDTGRVEQAIPLLKQALHLNPNYAEAHWELGYAFRFSGFLKESITECERARRLDPEVKLHSSAMNSYLYAGEYASFLASLPPDESAYILFYRGFGLFYEHHFAQAEADFERSYQTDPSLLQSAVGKALSLSMQGRRAEGIRLLKRTEAKIRERGVADGEGIYKVAQAYAVLGDKDSALRVLRETVERGFFCYPAFETDPLIASLRNESGFHELIRQSQARHVRLAAALAERTS